jgi:N-alpha-acetyltransferase 50
MTLGVLPPYRELGIGRGLLEHVLRAADVGRFAEVYLHVQVGNNDALAFYEHFGFSVKERIVNYYKRIQPADCLYIHKVLFTSPLPLLTPCEKLPHPPCASRDSFPSPDK